MKLSYHCHLTESAPGRDHPRTTPRGLLRDLARRQPDCLLLVRHPVVLMDELADLHRGESWGIIISLPASDCERTHNQLDAEERQVRAEARAEVRPVS